MFFCTNLPHRGKRTKFQRIRERIRAWIRLPMVDGQVGDGRTTTADLFEAFVMHERSH